MDYYNDVYRKRLNRYGTDYQSRTQGARERFFEDLLVKSIYRVNFDLNGELTPGVFEPYKQDETETLHYLLTRCEVVIPSGTVLWLKDSNKSDELHPWMVYYLEKLKASGYNRHIMLRMTHEVKWRDRTGAERSIWTYFYGQENNMLKDELKSRSRSGIIYNENLKMSFFVTAVNPDIKKDDYFEIEYGGVLQPFRVTGYDFISTPGVEFVTVDPVYQYDNSPAPEKQPGDNDDDFFWLEGGE